MVEFKLCKRITEDSDWRAAMTFLARRWPEKYGGNQNRYPKVTAEVTQAPATAPIALNTDDGNPLQPIIKVIIEGDGHDPDDVIVEG